MKKVGRIQFLGGSDIQQKSEIQNFGYEWGEPSSVPHLVANPGPTIKSTLRSVFDLKTVIGLEKVVSFKATNLQDLRTET